MFGHVCLALNSGAGIDHAGQSAMTWLRHWHGWLNGSISRSMCVISIWRNTQLKQRRGAQGETIACQYLRRQGWTIVARNVRTPLGELDIIACDQGQLVVVEVKSGRDDIDFPPELHLTKHKLEKLLQTTSYYQCEHPEPMVARIDLLVVVLRQSEPLIRHYKDITSG